MQLEEKEIKILCQALIHLQQAIFAQREAICSEMEAEQLKCKLWEALESNL